MKVYIVYQNIPYEGGDVIAIYTDEQKAIDLAMSDSIYSYVSQMYPYEVKEVELDTIFDLDIG